MQYITVDEKKIKKRKKPLVSKNDWQKNTRRLTQQKKVYFQRPYILELTSKNC